MADHLPDELLDQVAGTFRLLADPTRLAILRCLMEGERSVGQVVQETGQSQANVSKHLKMLADGGLVARRKAGLQVYYQVGHPLVDELCRLVCRHVVEGLRDDQERTARLLEAWNPPG